MAITEADVKVGGVYATAKNQQRRVTEIADGRVSYESRGGNVNSEWSFGHTRARPPKID